MDLTAAAWALFVVWLLTGAIAMSIVQQLKDAYAKVKAKFAADLAAKDTVIVGKDAEIAALASELAELKATMEEDAGSGFQRSGN